MPALQLDAQDLAAEKAGALPGSLIGRQLSQYKILSRIGAGGMGEVYLARDAKLERQVALKLLPVQFTTDAERLQRFVREAKAASALNHPPNLNIYCGWNLVKSSYPTLPRKASSASAEPTRKVWQSFN